jgi:hypothetical protein
MNYTRAVGILMLHSGVLRLKMNFGPNMVVQGLKIGPIVQPYSPDLTVNSSINWGFEVNDTPGKLWKK